MGLSQVTLEATSRTGYILRRERAVAALGNFCSLQTRDEVRQFFAHEPTPGAERALSKAIEQMDNCIEFRELQQANMKSGFVSEKERRNLP
jgi:hypothetical protein